MQDIDLLTQINEWANSSHAYLSNSTEFAKGYKDGISRAKEIAWQYKHPHPPYGYKKRIERFFNNM